MITNEPSKYPYGDTDSVYGQGRKSTKEQWDEAQLDLMSQSRFPADTLQGRTPAERAENESFGDKSCLGIIVSVAIGLAAWAILGWILGWWAE